MQQSPSWKANSSAASQEIPRIFRNPNVHYSIHNSPPSVHNLSQINLVHVPILFLEKLFDIILLSTPRSSNWSPSMRLPQQNSLCSFSPPYVPHAPSISFIWITLGDKYRPWRSSLYSLLQSPVTSCIFFGSPTLPQCERPSFKPVQNKMQNYSPTYINLYISYRKLEN